MIRLPLFILLLWFSGKLFAQNVSNYTFSATTGTFSVIQGSPGAVSPALSAGTWDDGYINNVPIGFTFMYDGASYTTVAVSTNGWARFGGTAGGSYLNNDLNNSLARPVVAPLWDDNFLTPGGFTYRTTGTAPNRVCTLEWLGVEWSYIATAPALSFQVKLYEATKRVEFIYRQEVNGASGASASIGINGGAAGQFISLNGTGASPGTSAVTETTTLIAKPATGQIYRFDHYPLVPVVTNVTPLAGIFNTVITITGSRFETVAANNIVHCGAVKANVISATATQLIAVIPPGTNTERITVTSALSNRTGESQEMFDVTNGCGATISLSTFSPASNYSIGVGLTTNGLLDVDLDGKPEVIVGGGGAARVYQNTSPNGSLSFGTTGIFTLSGNPFYMRFSDLDGDGKKEIITANNDDSISVLRNTSTVGSISASSFAPKVNFRVGDYASVDAADIDGDGRPEIVGCSRTNNRIEVRQNLTSVGVINTASFANPVYFTTGTGPYNVRIGDMDGDNKNDVIVCNYWDSTISVFRNTSVYGVINAASFAPRVDFQVGGRAMDIDLADIDGDGKTDIVSANQSASFSVLRNTGTPGTVSFANAYNYTSTYYSSGKVDIADFDGDGKFDVAIGQGNTTNYVAVCRNLSSPGAIAFAFQVNVNVVSDAFDLCTGDLNKDGRTDLLAVHLTAQGFTIVPNVNNTLNAIAPATVLGAQTFCDNGTWKTYNNPLDKTKVLFAVKDNGNNLGTITVDEYRDAAPGSYLGNRFLQRHFRIVPTTQPSSPVQIRLYFTNAELANLQAVDPSVTGVGSLSVTKYNGPTEDGTYNPADATSLTWYPPGSITTGTAYGGRYLEFTISSFSEFWIHGGSGVLPIELVSFDAEPLERTVALSWETASETNNDYFVIERSQDGTALEQGDTVDGAGNSTAPLSYSTIDQHPHEGLSYYRLKQVDFNGHYTYSEWKTVFIEPAATVAVYPNPTQGALFLQLPGAEDAQWNCTVINTMGQIVFASETSKAELKYLELNITPGTYFISLVSIGESSLTEPVNYSQQLIITDK